MKTSPYLFFQGQCREAMTRYQEVLGGEIVAMMTNADMPAGDEMPGGDPESIVHACLLLDGRTLMASDSPPQYWEKIQGFRVALELPTPEEAERVFEAFSDNAEISMPMQETFWAKRFGMLNDKYGTPWMIMCNSDQCPDQ